MPYDGTTDKRRPGLEACLQKLAKYAEMSNIADELDEERVNEIGMICKREYDIDKESRSDWEQSAQRAMDIALQVRKPKNYPFEGAANIKYPLVTIAALQFGARAYPAIVDGNRIVKGAPVGSDDGIPAMGPDGQPVVAQGPDGQPQPQWQVPPGAKREKAERIGQHMSWQLLYEMEEWEEDTDVLLHHLPIVGCAFRKVWRSDELGRNKAEMVPAIHLVVNDKARNLDDAPRVTHELFLYPHEIQERQLNGTFSDVDLPLPGEDASDRDAPHCLLEQHCFIDLDEDGYREPYIVTLHKDTSRVLRVVANFDFDEIAHDGKRITRIAKDAYFVKYSFLPDPKGGFYDIGFGKLLESLSETIDTMINQMIDAGHLQIAGGGFIGSGVSLKKGELRMSPGKYVFAQSTGSALKDAIVNLEHPGPTAVHMSLLELMLNAATDITSVKDIITGDTPEGKGVQTATTTLAMIEQGLKVFTAIYKRVYRALKQEFKLLFYLNAKHLDEQQYFTVLDSQKAVARADYDWETVDVVPVADPRTVTDMQKMARAQFLREFLGTGLVNDQNALKRVFDAVGIENPDELMPGQSPVADIQIKGLAAEVDDKIAAMELKQAQRDKTLKEAEMLDDQSDLEWRRQELDEFGSVVDATHGAKDRALAERQQGQAEAESEFDRGIAAQQGEFDQGMAMRQQEQAEAEGENAEADAEFQRRLAVRQQAQSEVEGAATIEQNDEKLRQGSETKGKKPRKRRTAADSPVTQAVKMMTDARSSGDDALAKVLAMIAEGQKGMVEAQNATAQAISSLAQAQMAVAQADMQPMEIKRDKSGRIASVSQGGRVKATLN